MAVVKKYESGGKNEEDFVLFLDKTLGENKVVKKNLIALQQAAEEKWDKLAKLDKETINKAFKYKPLSNTYEVDINQLPDELKGYDWVGSEKNPKKNLFGQFVADNPKDVNTILASGLYSYLQKYPGKTATKQDKNIADIRNYIQNAKFGGEDMFSELFDPMEDPAKQEYLKTASKENLLRYAKDALKIRVLLIIKI